MAKKVILSVPAPDAAAAPAAPDGTDATDRVLASKGQRRGPELRQQKLPELPTSDPIGLINKVTAAVRRLAKAAANTAAALADVIEAWWPAHQQGAMSRDDVARVFAEHGLIAVPPTDAAAKHVGRQYRLMRWAFSPTPAEARVIPTVSVGGEVYRNVLDALRHSGLAWSAVYDTYAAAMPRTSKRGRPTIPDNPSQAAESYIDRLRVPVRVRTAQQARNLGVEKTGRALVPVVNAKELALATVLALLRRFAWTDAERNRIMEAAHAVVEQPATPAAPEQPATPAAPAAVA